MNRIDEIRERMENASYGKWKVYKGADGVCIGTEENHPQLQSPMPIVTIVVGAEEPSRRIWISDENAEFIAHSHDDMNFLLEENERLNTLLEGNDGMSVKEIRSQFIGLHKDLLDAKKENERLKR